MRSPKFGHRNPGADSPALTVWSALFMRWAQCWLSFSMASTVTPGFSVDFLLVRPFPCTLYPWVAFYFFIPLQPRCCQLGPARAQVGKRNSELPNIRLYLVLYKELVQQEDVMNTSDTHHTYVHYTSVLKLLHPLPEHEHSWGKKRPWEPDPAALFFFFALSSMKEKV